METDQKPEQMPAAVTRSKTKWLFGLFALFVLAAGVVGLLIWKKPAAHPQVPVVWTLDNVTSIGGHKPEVLGAPQILDAAAGGPALRFNGQNDGLFVPVNPLAGWPKFTVEVLLLPETNCPEEQRFVYVTDDDGDRVTLETRSADGRSWCLDTCLWNSDNPQTLRDPDALHPNGKWSWVALVYDGETMSHYVNGVKELESATAFAPMTGGQVSLGVRNDRRYWFKGSIKEVRFIPEALNSNALQRVSEK
jgi:hypothetical protein